MDVFERLELLEKRVKTLNSIEDSKVISEEYSVGDILMVLNSTDSSMGKYPIGNKELTVQVKEMEGKGLIHFDKYYNKWKKGKGKAEESQGDHPPLVEEEDEDSGEADTEKYEGHLSQENLERFVDGLLTILGELELEGQVPAIETPKDARDALLAVVRRLYIRKSSVAKMSRKFARFGAKRFLRKQKNVIGKSVSQS